jgi:O-antigen/teichoic acid export membrane protein
MQKLIQAMLKTGSARAVSICFGIVSIKIFASVLGPYGVGLFSMLQQVLHTGSAIAAFGGQTAIVQGVASREEKARSTYLITVLWVMVFGVLLTDILMITSAPLIAKRIFHTSDASFANLIRWLSVPLVFAVTMTYFNSLLNGLRAIGRMAFVQVICAGVLTLCAYPAALSVSEGHPLAFALLLSLNMGAGAGMAFIFCLKAGWIKLITEGFKSGARLADLKAFFAFAGVMLILNFVTSGTLLVVRSLVVRHGGLEAAGIFGAAWSVSMQYVTLMLSSFSTYYLPSLTRLKNSPDRAALIESMMFLNIIIMTPLVTTVIVMKPLVICLLYAEDFLPSLEIMRWMLIGDYLRTTSWCFGMTLLAFARIKMFFWKELSLHLILLGIAYYAIEVRSDLEWLGVGALLINSINLLFLLIFVACDYQFARLNILIGGWLSGLSIVLIASWMTWEDVSVSWFKAVFIIAAALIHSLLFILIFTARQRTAA